jgi:uncharacterized protein
LLRAGVPGVWNVRSDQLASVCQRYGVRILSLFGSATRPDFRPDSDVDLMVEFAPESAPGLFGMIEFRGELARLFGRSIDLVTPEVLRNPYRRATIVPSLERLYVA